MSPAQVLPTRNTEVYPSHYTVEGEDVARTKFRLSIVLGEQKRLSEAARFKKEALELYERLVHPLPDSVTSHHAVEADMIDFDASVTLWHGRNSGMWGNGRPY